jgi:hypothetical protein
MPKVFWYYFVVAMGLGMIIFTMYKKRNFADLFSFFLSVTALGYLCEVIVLFVFNSYAYKPGVFGDPTAENIFGHLLCNGFFWGGTALLVAAFSLRLFWILLISIAYMLVEVFFIQVGAYEHNWWKLYMTGTGAFIFFIVVKRWFFKLQESTHRFYRGFSFFMISWVIMQGTTVLLSLFQKQHYIIGFVQNIYRDDILFSVPYQIFLSLIYVFFIFAHSKWYWKLSPLIINLLMDGIFLSMKILIFKGNWNFFYLAILRIIGFVIFILLEKYTLKFKPYIDKPL